MRAIIIEPAGNVTNDDVNVDMDRLVEAAFERNGDLRGRLRHIDVIYTGTNAAFTHALDAHFEREDTPDVEVRPFYDLSVPDAWEVREADSVSDYIRKFHFRNDILFQDDEDSPQVESLHIITDSMSNNLDALQRQALKNGANVHQRVIKNAMVDDDLFEYDI